MPMLKPVKDKVYNEQEMYCALMVHECLNDKLILPTEEQVKKYPYLHDLQADQGVMGIRAASIKLGWLIEAAFCMLTSDEADTLIQDCFGGCYDFEVVPFFVSFG